MAFDLSDEELQATREMNKTAWESEIDKWSREYLIERYKELVEIEKEHKKENGELKEKVKELEMQLLEKDLHIDGLKEDRRIAIEEIQEQYFVSKDKIKELLNKNKKAHYLLKSDIQELLEEREEER